MEGLAERKIQVGALGSIELRKTEPTDPRTFSSACKKTRKKASGLKVHSK